MTIFYNVAEVEKVYDPEKHVYIYPEKSLSMSQKTIYICDLQKRLIETVLIVN